MTSWSRCTFDSAGEKILIGLTDSKHHCKTKTRREKKRICTKCKSRNPKNEIKGTANPHLVRVMCDKYFHEPCHKTGRNTFLEQISRNVGCYPAGELQSNFPPPFISEMSMF